MDFIGLTWEQVCRRAGGRRAYNALRRDRAILRRLEVARLFFEAGAYLGPHGIQARIARQWGVSEATISRDIRKIRKELARRSNEPSARLRRAALADGLIEPSPAEARAHQLLDELNLVPVNEPEYMSMQDL